MPVRDAPLHHPRRRLADHVPDPNDGGLEEMHGWRAVLRLRIQIRRHAPERGVVVDGRALAAVVRDLDHAHIVGEDCLREEGRRGRESACVAGGGIAWARGPRGDVHGELAAVGLEPGGQDVAVDGVEGGVAAEVGRG